MGARKRFDWIQSELSKEDKVLEVGCGTGCMISLPLAAEGFLVQGLDLDQKSIEYGKKVAARSST